MEFSISFFMCYIFLWTPHVQCERHLLQYVYTALTKPAGFSGPKFSAVGLYDDRRISHYSNEEHTWKRDNPNSEIWRHTEEPDESRDWFINLVNTLANCKRSECDGLHTLQRRIGCEKDAEMNVKVFDEYRYDGEDFIVFNYDTMQWMEKNPKAKETKMKWNKQTGRNHYLQSFLETCMNWISTFNHSISNAPDVHMFSSEAHHDRSKLNLTCLATGFYPKHIEMKITLNDRNLEPFSSTGVRPNDDDTFQMRISVEIHRVDEEGYECHVSHCSGTNATSWNGNCSCSEESRRHDWAAAAAALFALVVLMVIFRCFYTRTIQKMLNRQKNSSNGSSGKNVTSRSSDPLTAPDSPENREFDTQSQMIGQINVLLDTHWKHSGRFSCCTQTQVELQTYTTTSSLDRDEILHSSPGSTV